MAKEPNHKTEKPFDSTTQHETNKAKIKEEHAQHEAVAKEDAENQEIANFHGFPKENETREQLLDRIRKMRDEKPAEPEPAMIRSEGLQKEFEAEQKAGQEAVAKAKAELDRNQAAVAKAEAEGEKKVG